MLTLQHREKTEARRQLATLIKIVVDSTLWSYDEAQVEMVMLWLGSDSYYVPDQFDNCLQRASEEDAGYYDPDTNEEEGRLSPSFAVERARLGDWRPLIDY